MHRHVIYDMQFNLSTLTSQNIWHVKHSKLSSNLIIVYNKYNKALFY